MLRLSLPRCRVSTLCAMAEVGAAPAELMPPPAPRAAPSRRVPAVLDEDEWTEQLEAIIERDYFPDKAKLENKLEWLQVLPALRGGLSELPCCTQVLRAYGQKLAMEQSPSM